MNKSIVNISVAYVSMNSYRKLDLFRKKIKSVQSKGGVDGGTCSSLIIVCLLKKGKLVYRSAGVKSIGHVYFFFKVVILFSFIFHRKQLK